MKFKNTLIILAVFALFLGYYFVFERKKPAPPAETTTKVITNLTKDQVDRFSLDKAGTHIVCKKEKGVWAVIEPRHAKTDPNDLDRFLSSVVDLSSEQVVEESPQDLSIYGLKKPYLTIQLSTADNKTKTAILIGDSNPSNTMNYMKLRDYKAVHEISITTKNNLDKSLYDLRDKSLLSIQEDAVDKIQLAEGDKSFVLEKKAGTWYITKPFRHLANNDRIKSGLRTLAHGTAASFEQEPLTSPATYHLNKPLKTIDFWQGKDKQSISFAQVQEKNAKVYYATRSAVSDCVKVQEYIINAFNAKQDELMDKKIFHMDINQADNLEMTTPALHLKAKRGKNNLWSVTAEPKAKIDPNQINSLVYELYAMEYSKAVDAKSVTEAQAGWSKPQATITWVISGSPATKCSLVVGKNSADNTKVWIRSQDPGEAYQIDRSFLDRLPKAK